MLEQSGSLHHNEGLEDRRVDSAPAAQAPVFADEPRSKLLTYDQVLKDITNICIYSYIYIYTPHRALLTGLLGSIQGV